MTFRRAIGACIVAVLFVGAPVSCLIETETPQGNCKADTDCDDKNPCTDDTCAQDGFCDHPVREAPPEGSCPDNNPCTKEACGADGKCTNIPDNMLVPDDGNECTVDTCENAAAQHTNVPDMTKCGNMGVLECTGGKCVCANTADCGVSTACITYECKAMACTSTAAPKGTLVDNAGNQDCKKNVCDGIGGITSAADTGDAPPDTTFNDCKKPGCDTNGMIIDVADPNDLPVDDMNVCTNQGCNGMMSFTMNLPDGTGCGDAQVCAADGAGGFQTVFQPACMAGVCQGANPQSCGLFACNNNDCRTTCTLDTHCIATAYCDVPSQSCKVRLDQGQPCSADNLCKSNHCADGVCCGTTCGGTCESCNLNGTVGTCTKIPNSQDPDNECVDPQACNGAGACAKPQGSTCTVAGDCLDGICEDNICCATTCTGACRRCDISGMVGTCTNVVLGDQATGCSNGMACDGAGNCLKQQGQPCNGGSECVSGFCPSEGGSQKVCCDKTCTSTCQSCRGMKTGGVDGVCSFVKVNTDPDNECNGSCNNMTGSGCCDGNGMCIP